MLRLINFYSITGTLLLFYIIARAFSVDVTFDEAWTLMDFVPLNIWHVLNCTPCDANNHIVNTLLIKLVYLFAPDSLFWARVPNIVAGFFYVYLGSRIAIRFLPKNLGYAFFILLIANPFLIEFFSLARGYGLSLTFMIASIHSLLLLREDEKLKNAFSGVAWASLAVLSNFTLLNYWCGAVFIVFYIIIGKGLPRKTIRKAIGVVLFWSLFLLAVMYEPIRKLLEQDGFYYGGVSGFYQETVGSLFSYSNYRPYQEPGIIMHLLTFIFFTALITGFTAFRPAREFIMNNALILTILTIIPILSNIIQRIFLDTLYLVSRTALFYYPLFVLIFLFWIAEIRLPKLRAGFHGMAGIVTLVFVMNFLSNANFYKTITWEFDAHTKEILNSLDARAQENNTTYQISGTRLFIRGVLYQVADFPHLKYVHDEDIRDTIASDYYLYFDKELKRIYYDGKRERIHQYTKDTIMSFPEEGVYVFSNFERRD